MYNLLAITSINISIIDIIDVVLVALLLYRMYYLVKGTVAVNIFIGILFIYLLWLVVKYMEMRLFGTILEKFIDVGFIALIVVFQPEIRRFLLFIGTTNFRGVAKGFFDFRWQAQRSFDLDVPSIVKACRNMAETKTGAIIVITKNAELKFYANTGEPIDAYVSVKLIESIFYKNSPLHDGAIIISNNIIKAARCVLPVTENSEFPADLGMRHRAAVGITENSDS
ncbi:MAG: diadenylate cyclase, partial [Bacteroidia bacterium]|nr:diadenylate cyclase [Bacteroidia bacterium]